MSTTEKSAEKATAKPSDKPTEGIPPWQEAKFTIKGGVLVNRQSGKPIPDDEPVFIMRAGDRWAAEALRFYIGRIRNGDHATAVRMRLAQFEAFAVNNPDRMHEPDTTLTADWSAMPPTPPAKAAPDQKAS